MTGTIILDDNNLSSTGVFDATTTPAPYNTMVRNMRGISLRGRKIGLKKLYMYYSWPNVMNQTSITIQWPVGASYNTYVWTLPAKTNYASATDLNASLQQFCIANGLYLKSGTDNVYFITLRDNASTYKITLDLFAIPTSAGSYTAPGNWVGYPTTTKTPRFTIPTGSELSRLIGFAAATYDGVATSTQYASTFVPQFSPVSAVYITCNVAVNDVPINGSTVISSFTTRGTPFGAMITVEPSQVEFYDVSSNSNELEIAFYDQDWNKLYVQDPQTMVQLSVI